ncbi:MAG: 50S ribosomal protein L3 [Bradymonadia bacterium]
MKGILGRKIGMTSIFREDGTQVPVTVLDVTGNTVVGKRTQETDGYTAVTLGFGEQRISRMNKPRRGFFEKAGLVEERDGKQYAKRHIQEFRVSGEELDGFETGNGIKASDVFMENERVDVTGTSKGKGFSGVMKRHNFKGTKASHGVHEYFRHGGSIGMCAWPARVFKNKKMPGQYGNERSTVQNVQVIEIMEEEGLMLIKGGLPGANGAIVRIQHAAKGRKTR